MKKRISFILVVLVLIVAACEENEPSQKKASLICEVKDITSNSVVLECKNFTQIYRNGINAFLISKHYASIDDFIKNEEHPAAGKVGAIMINGQYREDLDEKHGFMFGFAGNSVGNSSLLVLGLKPNTKYYATSYSRETPSEGGEIRRYSKRIEFTTDRTLEVIMGNYITVSDIALHTAKITAFIDSEGLPAYTERGFCYDFYNVENIATANNKVIVQGSGEGEFSGTLNNLKNGRNYKVRAYATNIHGTVYSSHAAFRTKSSDFLLSDGLIAYYNFDNENGKESQGIDYYDGISQGNPTFLSTSPDGTGKSLYGGDGYFYVVNNPFENIKDTDWTILLWVKTMTPNTVFFNIDLASPYKISVRLRNGYLMLFATEPAAASNYYYGFDIPITNLLLDDIWHLITITREKADNFGRWKYKLYIDGIYYEEKIYNYGLGSNKPLLLGYGLLGNLDNFRIYNRILTQQEINILFNTKK